MNTRLVYLAFFLIAASIIGWVFLSPPGIYTDSAWGFNAWKSFQQGTALNYVAGPDLNNIAVDKQGFMTHWTPGQYVLPGILMATLGCSLGDAIVAIVILFSAAGLLGFYKLFKQLGYNHVVLAFAMLVLISQKYTSLPFSFYNGGEVLIYGFMPWVLLYVVSAKKKNALFFVGLLLMHCIGFFLKSSYLIFAVASSAVIVLQETGISFNIFKRLWDERRIVFLSGTSLVFSYLLFWKYFLSRGHNPSSTAGFSAEAMDLVFPLASPIGAAFSLDDILNRVFYFPGSENPFAYPMWFLYVPIAILSVFIIIKLLKGNRKSFVLAAFLICYITVLTMLYLLDADISYEFRHFRMLGLLMIPACIELAFASRFVLKYSLFLLIFLSSSFGLLSFAQRKLFAEKNYFRSNENFLYVSLKQPTFGKLQELDNRVFEKNIILYTPNPEINLELKNLRLITQHTDFIPLNSLQSQRFYGKVDTLYVLLQKEFLANGKTEAVLNSFDAYNKFELWYEDASFQIYKSY
jgi:hypothetical protein